MAMGLTQGRGNDNPTNNTQEANKPSGQEGTKSGNVVTRYCRLLHRSCASLDLKTTFKNIKIHRILSLTCAKTVELKSANAQPLR